MSPSSSSRSSKPKPAEVAAETKRFLKKYASSWPAFSYLFAQPLAITADQFPPRTLVSLAPPTFHVRESDPVDFATTWSASSCSKVAFICAANEKRPGGDWETGVVGYEERLCRRSNLSTHLQNPKDSNYPIPCQGGLYSGRVVVFKGPHDRYEQRDHSEWRELPVVSVVPVRWPKLRANGTTYSFDEEYKLAKAKMRAALTICVYNDIRSVVIGDFGLGSYRNPPQATAEMWRDVLLWDPSLRGRINSVAFVFDDRSQSTVKIILDDAAKKSRSGGGSSSGSSGSSSSSSSKNKGKAPSHSSSSAGAHPTDFDIFEHVFSSAEVNRVMTQSDTRMGLQNIVS